MLKRIQQWLYKNNIDLWAFLLIATIFGIWLLHEVIVAGAGLL